MCHHPITHLCAEIGALHPSYNRERCHEILDAAGEAYAPKGFLVHGNLFLLNLMFSRQSRIIVDISQVVARKLSAGVQKIKI